MRWISKNLKGVLEEQFPIKSNFKRNWSHNYNRCAIENYEKMILIKATKTH